MLDHNRDVLISIVVPVYNVEKFIDRCMESLIGQTYKNVEIILVNDGSQDASGDRCDYYAQHYKNVKCIHQSNKGVSVARSEGFNKSIGDYILYIDPDDYVEKDTIEQCMSVLLSEKLDILVFMKDSYILGKNLVGRKQIFSGSDACREALLDRRGGIVASIVKRHIIEKTNYSKLRFSEDAELCYRRYFLSDKVGFFDYPFYHVVNDNLCSLTRSMPTCSKRFDTVLAYENRVNFIENNPIFSDCYEYNMSQLLKACLSFLTTLYFDCSYDNARKTEEYKYVKRIIELNRNNVEVKKRLRKKNKLYLACFEKNKLHYWGSKLSYWYKNKIKKKHIGVQNEQ